MPLSISGRPPESEAIAVIHQALDLNDRLFIRTKIPIERGKY
jgi:hypothetical protein